MPKTGVAICLIFNLIALQATLALCTMCIVVRQGIELAMASLTSVPSND